jgi:kynurenine formamidase
MSIWVSGSNGQLLTHSDHLGTHLDGEIHFHTAGKDIAQLELNDFLVGPGVVVDLSDATGDYQIYTPEMIEERADVREGDILVIHTGYHHFGWDQPYADEIPYMVQHPGPDRDFAVWAKAKKIKWIAVDCGSADHPMNTIIRDWMPRQAFVDGESSIGRCVAMVGDDEYQELMARKAKLPKTRFGDCYDPEHVERVNKLTR